MRQVPDFADKRNKGFCVHCGAGDISTRDHVPSKVFLDKPFPPNLPVTPCCAPCNARFSPDEQYLACLLECVATGEVDVANFKRSRVARAVEKDAVLRTTLERARNRTGDSVVWMPDDERVRNVVVKLARGHAAFELSEPQLGEPDSVWAYPLHLLNDAQRRTFERDDEILAGWPEVGSRAFHRILVADDAYVEGWLVVQKGRYRYRVSQHGSVCVRMVIRDYLACQVDWE